MTTAVHMMHSLQYYMKSGQLTQRLGQDSSRKLTSTISSHCLHVSKNISMVRLALKLPETLSDMELHSQSPDEFPYRTRGTSVSALVSKILAPHNYKGIFHGIFEVLVFSEVLVLSSGTCCTFTLNFTTSEYTCLWCYSMV